MSEAPGSAEPLSIEEQLRPAMEEAKSASTPEQVAAIYERHGVGKADASALGRLHFAPPEDDPDGDTVIEGEDEEARE